MLGHNLKIIKSVVGRAIVGTILPFGALGTVVGAVSGIGTKQKKKRMQMIYGKME